MRVGLAIVTSLIASVVLAGEQLTPLDVSHDCVACALQPQDLGSLYSEEESAALRAGKVLTADEGQQIIGDTKARVTRAAGVILHPPGRVWDALTDFESWPGFMPHIEKTAVVRNEGTRSWVEQHFSVLYLDMRHTTIYEFEPRGGELRWQLDLDSPHDIAASRGRWQLAPIDGGAHTLVRYRAAMDAGRAVPAFVEDMLVRRSLRKLIGHLREEVDRREREHPSPEP